MLVSGHLCSLFARGVSSLSSSVRPYLPFLHFVHVESYSGHHVLLEHASLMESTRQRGDSQRRAPDVASSHRSVGLSPALSVCPYINDMHEA